MMLPASPGPGGSEIPSAFSAPLRHPLHDIRGPLHLDPCPALNVAVFALRHESGSQTGRVLRCTFLANVAGALRTTCSPSFL